MKQLLKKFLAIGLMAMGSSGFVLLRASEPRLTLDENSSVTFIWDGTLPKAIEKREKYTDADIVSLDDKEAFRILLHDAASRWSSVPGAKIKVQIVEGDVKTVPDDLLHVITVNDDSGTGGVAVPITGEAFKDQGREKKEIADCDITIGGGKFEALWLAEVLTHELGHCLGLGHSHTNFKSLMGYSRSESTPALGADDMAGIIYLYPNDELTREQKEIVTSCGVVGNLQAHTSSLPMILFLIGATIIFPFKRRSSLGH